MAANDTLEAFGDQPIHTIKARMKTRFVAFIVRIRLNDSEPGPHGALQQAGDALTQPFDTFDRLVELLRSAIAALEYDKPDRTKGPGVS